MHNWWLTKYFLPHCMYTLLHFCLFSSERFEVLGPSDSIVAVAGEDIILPCYLKPNISAEDMTVDWLKLDFLDGRVFRYQNHRIIRDDQIPSYRRRTSLFEEELWRGNTSLKLTRVQGTDEGHYKCFIKSICVSVAVGSKPVVSIEGHREGGMCLLCESEGWHPEPELVWLNSKESISLLELLRYIETSRDSTESNNMSLSRRLTPTALPAESNRAGSMRRWRQRFTSLVSNNIILFRHETLEILINRRRSLKEKERKWSRQSLHLDVTLDPDTSSPWVTLSEDRKQVRHGETRQDLPDNPERFDNTACVLGKEGFSSGSFYYEVQVKGKTWWKLGVVRESINKKGRITLSPDDGFWTVWLWNGEYKAATTPHVTLLLREKPLKVGVFVDYEKGQVSFYNVEARCHIYSFTGCTFTEKLYPFFNPGGSDSISLVVCPVDPQKNTAIFPAKDRSNKKHK
uniref:B30.2/SPRY domain-containing protein n=1 Tax=Oncorhynchus tshawytscha TaxID=74940 RepID=A0A8C8IQY2_ONCTS